MSWDREEDDVITSLADEGDFLMLQGLPGSGELRVGDWVEHMDVNGEPFGWMMAIDLGYDDLDREREVDLHAEVLTQRPADPVPERFARVVEVSVHAPADLSDELFLPEGAGAHRVRLMLDDTADPPEVVVAAWPEPASAATVIRNPDPPPEPDTEPALLLPEAEAGLAGAARIGRDASGDVGARALSGELGVVRRTAVLPGAASGRAWTFSFAQSAVPEEFPEPRSAAEPWDPRDPDRVRWSCWVMRRPDHRDQIAGWRASIWTTPHPEDQHPFRRVLWWKWVRRDPTLLTRKEYLGRILGPVLAQDTVLDATFTALPGPPEQTRVELEHRDVPIEWVQDLTDWWTYQLAIIALYATEPIDV